MSISGGYIATAICCFAFAGAAFAAEVAIPDGPEVTAQSGQAVVIYGQRGRNCRTVPSFESLVERKDFTTLEPKNGTLFDAGTGKRRSRSCRRRVPVRAIGYKPNPGFTGTDQVIFWNQDVVIIHVK